MSEAVLRLNDIQAFGTEDSYHIAPDKELLEHLTIDADKAAELEYTHEPLWRQLDEQSVRLLKFDVFADPKGGLFTYRAGLNLMRVEPRASDPAMYEPGFKVLRIPHIDFETHCSTLVQGLSTVAEWSAANSHHVPILIVLAVRGPLEESSVPVSGQPLKCGPDELLALEKEIQSVFAREHVLIPDEVRSTASALRDAVLRRGWPEVEALRGRVLFGLTGEPAVVARYCSLSESLAQRTCFPNSPTDEPTAGWLQLPPNSLRAITERVEEGFLVQTAAVPGEEESVLLSGAHYVGVKDPSRDAGVLGRSPRRNPVRCSSLNADGFKE